jgi:RNA polymerase sigma factor (sigma-70 family)
MGKCQNVAAGSDTPSVGKHEDEHLRRFLAARDRGDGAQMAHWWGELLVDFFDRMDNLVYAAHRGRLDDQEHEDAVQLAMTRFATRLIETFEGVSMGELINACRTLARGICMDVQRSSMRLRAHADRSLDAGWDADDEPAPTWESDAALRRFEQDGRDHEVREFLDWALPQVKEERRRVLELTFHGAEVAEIAAELDITHDNAYQRRSRGLKDLKKLKEQFDA